MNLERIIESLEEPEWLKNLRKENLNLFLKHPFPKWKRVDISNLKIEEIDFSKREFEFNIKEDNALYLFDSKNPNGKIIDEPSYLFTDLSSALKLNPELLKKLIEKNLIPSEEGKFQALGNSLWKNGFFLHVKKGSKIERPIVGKNISLKDKTLINRTIIYAERDSEFTFIEDFQSEEMDESSFKISLLEIYLEEDVTAKVVSLNRRKGRGWDFFFKKGRIGSGSNLKDISIEIGEGNSIGNFSIDLNERNSNAEISSIIASKNKSFDHLFHVTHISPNTRSSIFSRGIVDGTGKGVWRGLTHVKKGAKGADVFQKSEIILMGKESKADAIPSLWIDENDCRASHGASVFPLNLEKIFYFESRGIEPSMAKNLIGKGFLMSVLNKEIEIDGIEGIIEDKLR
jgi:Fe-S cluster assembly protein SufD